MEEATTSGIVTHKKVTMAAEPLGTKELYRKIEEFSEIIDMLRLEVSILVSKVDNLERNITSLPVSVRIVEVKERKGQWKRQKRRYRDIMRNTKANLFILTTQQINSDLI